MPDLRRLGDLVQRRGQSAAGGVAQHVDVGAGGEHRRHQAVERRGVATQLGAELEALADAHHGDAVHADRRR